MAKLLETDKAELSKKVKQLNKRATKIG